MPCVGKDDQHIDNARSAAAGLWRLGGLVSSCDVTPSVYLLRIPLQRTTAPRDYRFYVCLSDFPSVGRGHTLLPFPSLYSLSLSWNLTGEKSVNTTTIYNILETIEVDLVLSGHHKGVLDVEVCLGKALIDVALAPCTAGKSVGGILQRSREADIAVHLGMQDESILPQSLQRIEHGGQFLILHA